MTSFAFIFGVVPLVIAHGAGAEMRRSLGTAVFGGMLGVTLFGLVLTPVFFSTIDWLSGSRLFASRLMRWLGGAGLFVTTLGTRWLARTLVVRRRQVSIPKKVSAVEAHASGNGVAKTAAEPETLASH